MKKKPFLNTKTICSSLLLITALFATNNVSFADVVKANLCNTDRIIIRTLDNWYATAIYIDGYQLREGDQLANDEIHLQIENQLTLQDQSASGNYFITSIKETEAEASNSACQ